MNKSAETQRELNRKKLSSKIASRDGIWLSGEYMNGKSYIRLQCEHGHEWETRVLNIQTDRWCPVCARKRTVSGKRRIAHINKIKRQVEYIRSGRAYIDRVNQEIRRMKATRAYKTRIRRLHYLTNRDVITKKYRDRYHKEEAFNLNEKLQTHLRKVMLMSKNIGKYQEYVGCSNDDLLLHMQNQFKKGMSWANYGEWEIDHIKPKSAFNFYNEDGSLNDCEMKRCWHYSNLQPLWAIENAIKGSKYKN